jgi:hypothetical protein
MLCLIDRGEQSSNSACLVNVLQAAITGDVGREDATNRRSARATATRIRKNLPSGDPMFGLSAGASAPRIKLIADFGAAIRLYESPIAFRFLIFENRGRATFNSFATQSPQHQTFADTTGASAWGRLLPLKRTDNIETRTLTLWLINSILVVCALYYSERTFSIYRRFARYGGVERGSVSHD